MSTVGGGANVLRRSQSLSKDGLGPRVRGGDELCKGLPSRERRMGTRERKEEAQVRREGARGNGEGLGLSATLSGLRVAVALGSRLRGNDEGLGLSATLSGLWVAVALGSRLRGNDEGGRANERWRRRFDGRGRGKAGGERWSTAESTANDTSRRPASRVEVRPHRLPESPRRAGTPCP